MFRFAQHDPGDAEGLLGQSVLLDCFSVAGVRAPT